MTPWVNRQQVTGPALHALVIGVSEYLFLPATNDEFPRDDKVTLGLTRLKTPAGRRVPVREMAERPLLASLGQGENGPVTPFSLAGRDG
jgi:hypothetical protein